MKLLFYLLINRNPPDAKNPQSSAFLKTQSLKFLNLMIWILSILVFTSSKMLRYKQNITHGVLFELKIWFLVINGLNKFFVLAEWLYIEVLKSSNKFYLIMLFRCMQHCINKQSSAYLIKCCYINVHLKKRFIWRRLF